MTHFGRVAVLMGGQSPEREISLQSGHAVLAALKESHVDAHAFDPACLPLTELVSFDRVFNILHGAGGENGQIQGLLSSLNIPFTGSGVLGSALSMNKSITKQIWQQNNILTPKSCVVDVSNPHHVLSELSLPFAIKPVGLGSSIGISKVTHAKELNAAVNEAKSHGSVMAEEWITGKEITVPIVGRTPLPSIWIEPSNGYYDYKAKYQSKDTQYHCPSSLSKKQEQHIQEIALAAFDCCHCYSWARVDFIQDQQGDFYAIEMNTSPGMTQRSLVPMAALKHGWSFNELVLTILKHTQRSALTDPLEKQHETT